MHSVQYSTVCTVQYILLQRATSPELLNNYTLAEDAIVRSTTVSRLIIINQVTACGYDCNNN